jgi:hypothetical protein
MTTDESTKTTKADRIKAKVAALLKSKAVPDEEAAFVIAKSEVEIEDIEARQKRALESVKAAAKELRKAKSAQKKALTVEERRARTHKLCDLGGLVEKAGIGDADPATLLGFLLEFSRQSAEHKAAWKATGQAAMAKDAPANPSKGQAVEKPAAPIAGRLYLEVPMEEKDAAKALGAKWDAGTKKWHCDPAEKDKFAKWFRKGA